MIKKLLNSKWTSVKEINGWRHYEVSKVLRKEKQLELFAVCDKKIYFLVSFNEIEDKDKWLPGWREIVQ